MKTILLAVAGALHFAPLSLGNVEDPPAIALTIEVHEGADDPILMAVWSDGLVIWAKDQVKGGPPFLTARVEATKVDEFLTHLAKKKVFEKDEDFLVHFGPDSDYHSLRIRSGKKQVELLSWHELFEANPNLIATSHGITSLDGEKREDVLKADAKEYQEFRKLWSEIRDFTTSLIPREGKPYPQALKLKFDE
jgi:hypothetical protein